MLAWIRPSSATPTSLVHSRRQIAALGGVIIILVLGASYTLAYQASIGHVEDLSAVPPVGYLALQLFLASTGWQLTTDLQTATSYQFLRSRLLRFGSVVGPAVLLGFFLIRYAGVPGMHAEPSALPANLLMAADLIGSPRIDEAHWRLKIELMLTVELGLVWFGLGPRHLRTALGVGLVATTWLLSGEPARQDMLTLTGLLTLDGYLPCFAFGVALQHVQKARPDWGWVVLLVAAAALGFLSNTTLHGVVLMGGFAVLALASAGRVNVLGRMKWLVRLGQLAFPIYVVHRVAGFAIIYHLERHGIRPAVAIAAAGATVVLIGWMAHHVLERPAAALVERVEQLDHKKLWSGPGKVARNLARTFARALGSAPSRQSASLSSTAGAAR